MRVGFVGLGDIGAPMAHMIERQGFPLTLWARRSESLDPFGDTHAQRAPTLHELGSACDVVGVCVTADADVEEVVLGDNLLAGMQPGSVLAIHSTIHPDACRRLAGKGAERGVEVVDAPVTGGPEGVWAKSLAVMVGADPATFERVRPVFESFGRPVLLGPVGSGQLAKLVNQALAAATVDLVHETVHLAAALDLEWESLLGVLREGVCGSYVMDAYVRQRKVGQRPEAPELLAKDIEHFVRVMEAAGIEHESLSTLARRGVEVVRSFVI